MSESVLIVLVRVILPLACGSVLIVRAREHDSFLKLMVCSGLKNVILP